SSKCAPCNESEFIEYPNDFAKCLGCQMCREDQVELSPCRADRNTQCACKNGTFCSPDHPCEMCQKCRPRCPKGEVELAPCTPHGDRQCGPPTSTSSGSSGKWGAAGGGGTGRGAEVGAAEEESRSSSSYVLFVSSALGNLIAIVVVAVVVTLFAVGCCFWRCYSRQSPGERWVSSEGPGLVEPGAKEAQERPSGSPQLPDRRLEPGVGVATILRRSFDILAEFVPLKDWKRYGRALDLLENDIDLAEKNDKYSREAFFQMLNTWHNKQGMNASINTLLDTLHQINLGGIAEDISTKLVQQGFFQYEVS
ncbi:TR10B factor, partial [Todus mexicanus]|nr:TR10B factor [Todus mexicanus]